MIFRNIWEEILYKFYNDKTSGAMNIIERF